MHNNHCSAPLRLLAMLLCLCLPVISLADVIELPIDTTGGLPYNAVFDRNVMTYDDPSIHVERYRVANDETDYNCIYYYAFINVANASQIRTAAVNGFENRNRAKVAVMARRMNAILAIDGDFYGERPNCFVLRQGKVYRDNLVDNQDVLLIDEDGDFHVILAKDDAVNADKTTWNGKKIINAFSFGPALIINDEVVLDESSSPVMSQPESRAERMVIAQLGPLQYMVLCCREVGCTAQEIVKLVQETVDHVEVAYLLDGGQSTQLVFLGTLINKEDRNAREVTDILYFASAYQED